MLSKTKKALKNIAFLKTPNVSNGNGPSYLQLNHSPELEYHENITIIRFSSLCLSSSEYTITLSGKRIPSLGKP